MMPASHFNLLVLFSLFISAVFAALLRDSVREQMVLGGFMFGGLILSAMLFGWFMYPFPL